ncbi:MAG TPA: LytR C-terminal domain-containing protein [Actinophytocola sp.]|nr:LytR C-terminal domain-containing protein [Actinophytocola sp.]
MSSPESSSATRPLRVAGVVLLGVAAIALIIGLLSLFDGDGDNEAKPPPSSTTSEPTTTESRPSSPTAPPSSRPPSSSSQAPTSTTPPDGSSAPVPPPGGDGNGEPGKTQPVRIYNNSTIPGLAARAADELRDAGWNVIEVGNYAGGVIPTTTAYYRPGTAEQAAAEDLGDNFGMRVEPRFAGISGFQSGVIVILTNDYQGLGGDGGGDGGGKNEGK